MGAFFCLFINNQEADFMKNATILHVPHASITIPPQYLSSFDKSKLSREIAVMTDWFCDELFDCGRDKIVFPISRLVCDAERFRDDKEEIMAKIGMGVAYRTASDMSPLRNVTEKEKREILSQYYDPHHRAFTEAVREKLNAFGQCLIVDCHSFYPTPLPYEMDKSTDRPDFCIGTSAYHTPRALTDALYRFLSGNGYRVKVNSPFAGTIVPMQYYETDKRVRSVMIEVNRGLYMDIPGEVPTGDFIRKWYSTKRIVIPRVNGEQLDLCEYDPQKIQEGYKGILEPAAEATIVNPEEIELALVPGVAFTHSGARLGRGKGFYDRLLPKLKCPCIGIGFSFRWVDEIPTDPWDAPLSII